MIRLIQGVVEQLYSSSKCYAYKYFIDSFHLKYYLSEPIPKLYHKYISKYRLSSHKLFLETVRFCNTRTNERLCIHCKAELENKYNFVLVHYTLI
jgi:hypothetical protein